VRELQQVLTERGFSVRADGVFGSETADAVRGFQQSVLLEVDAQVGPATFGALGVGVDLEADLDSVDAWVRALTAYLNRGDVGDLPGAAVRGLSGFVYDTSGDLPFAEFERKVGRQGSTMLTLRGQDQRGNGPVVFVDVCITDAPRFDWCGIWSVTGD
jgi:hypothetical protein